VEQRQHHPHALARSERDELGAHCRVGQDVVVGEHRPFGLAGRARGVEHGRQVVTAATRRRHAATATGEGVECELSSLVDRDHGLQVRQSVAHGREPLGPGLVGDRCDGHRMAGDICDLRRRQRRVDRAEHGARLQHRPPRLQELEAVGKQYGDDLAGLHAEVCQAGRQRVRAGIELGEGDGSIAPADERLAGNAAGLGAEQVREGLEFCGGTHGLHQ
jgi:hypothetical protein